MTNNKDLKPTGFGIGMVIGLLSGAGAFYIFGSEKGHELKKQFIKDFEKAKEELKDDPDFIRLKEKAIKAIEEITPEKVNLFKNEKPTKSIEPSKRYFKKK